MGTIAENERQLTLYYNSKSDLGKKSYAYLQTTDKEFLGIDVTKTKVTGTEWAEIADGLGVPISDLVNVESPEFIEIYGDSHPDMSPEDWIKILQKEPQLLKYPIALDGYDFKLVKTPTEFIQHLGG